MSKALLLVLALASFSTFAAPKDMYLQAVDRDKREHSERGRVFLQLREVLKKVDFNHTIGPEPLPLAADSQMGQLEQAQTIKIGEFEVQWISADQSFYASSDAKACRIFYMNYNFSEAKCFRLKDSFPTIN